MSFNVEVDLDVIADHSRRFGDSKVLAIDGQAGVRAHHFPHLPGIRRAFQFKGQVNILGDSLDRERAMGHIIIALLFHRFALEGDLRKFSASKKPAERRSLSREVLSVLTLAVLMVTLTDDL